MVPLTGLEPVRYRYRGILSPLCLPIPPQRHIINNIIVRSICQGIFAISEHFLFFFRLLRIIIFTKPWYCCILFVATIKGDVEMWTSKKSIMLSLILTYVFMVLLVAVTIAMPWLVTWYVETKGRSASLPTTIMLTCYPCVPFAAVTLLSLRRVLKNLSDGQIFIPQNVIMFKRISWCCVAASLITLVAGRYYLPFYIVSASAAFFALITRVFKNIIEVRTSVENEAQQ